MLPSSSPQTTQLIKETHTNTNYRIKHEKERNGERKYKRMGQNTCIEGEKGEITLKHYSLRLI